MGGEKKEKMTFWLPDMCFWWLIVLVVGFKLKINAKREEKKCQTARRS